MHTCNHIHRRPEPFFFSYMPRFLYLTAILFTFTLSYQQPALAGPAALGMGNARMVDCGGADAATLNPAVLGSQTGPWGALQVAPLLNSYTAGYWSDKLALKPYREFFSIGKDGQWQKIVAQIINESFNVAGRTPEETSDKITRKIDGGTSVFSNAGITLLGVTIGKIAVDIRTMVDARVDVPDAPFLILFSEDNGLKPGADFSLTHLGAQVAATTDINLGYGQPLDISRITERINDFTRDFTDIKYTSWGAGATVSLGQGFLDLTTSGGGIHYSDDGSQIVMDADATLLTSGTGIRDDYAFGNPFEGGFSFAGFGAGINAGLLMYGEHSTVSIALRRLGPMIWQNVRQGDIHVRSRDVTIAGLFEEKKIDLFDPDKGGVVPDEHDSLRNIGTLLRWQPTRFNIGFGYRFNFLHRENQKLRALSEFVNTSLEYEQSLAPWPGRSFIPRLAIGAENGFLWGVMPIQAGFVFGGTEGIASTAGFAIGTRICRLQVAYEAIGTPYWYPKRGFVVSAGFSTEWRQFRDPDRDGITDKKDRCGWAPEDIDGFHDDDGCPDFDNDADGIPDSLDKCSSAPEDIDGFNDTDGCPDFDNDADGIPDSIDKCINVPEDADGFSDTDGCPDSDNDIDGIFDSLDKCGIAPEDIDGFGDTDGCPDFDNDTDGVPDSSDHCMNVAEDSDSIGNGNGCPDADTDRDGVVDTLDSCPGAAENFNFVNDSDGCPDTAIYFSGDQNTRLGKLLSAVRFDSSGNIGERALRKIDSIVILLNSIPSQHYLLCWIDSALADSACSTRATTIAGLLSKRGVEPSRIAVPVNGCGMHCSNCIPKTGGTLFIRYIETVDKFRAITGNNTPSVPVPGNAAPPASTGNP